MMRPDDRLKLDTVIEDVIGLLTEVRQAQPMLRSKRNALLHRLNQVLIALHQIRVADDRAGGRPQLPGREPIKYLNPSGVVG